MRRELFESDASSSGNMYAHRGTHIQRGYQCYPYSSRFLYYTQSALPVLLKVLVLYQFVLQHCARILDTPYRLKAVPISASRLSGITRPGLPPPPPHSCCPRCPLHCPPPSSFFTYAPCTLSTILVHHGRERLRAFGLHELVTVLDDLIGGGTQRTTNGE